MVKLRARKRLNPERRKGFSILKNSPDLFSVPPSSVWNTYQGSFLGVKLPGCEFDTPSGSKDTNEWIYVPICSNMCSYVPMCAHMCPCVFMASIRTIVKGAV